MTGIDKRVLIVDDEPAARAQLRDVIDSLPGLVVDGEVSDGESAIEAINKFKPDIVFLDIDMPGVDGFGVARATEHLMYQLIFVTAHHQHALQAFETHAIDYLLKPARPSVIERCINKILRQEVLTLKSTPRAGQPTNLVLTDSGTTRIINPDHVLYVEGLGRYRRIHLSKAGAAEHKLDTVLSDTTLDDFAEQLGGAAFVRTHRSYLINLTMIRSLQAKGRRYDLLLKGSNEAVPVARSRVKTLKAMLDMI